jgi:acid phosphatase (class A)
MFALVLCTIMPERTNEILVRSEKYAQNRVVCGHHWKSDIDASLLLAAGMFANVVRTEAFQEQLKKARAEYLAIIGGSTDVTPETNAEPRTAAVYP